MNSIQKILTYLIFLSLPVVATFKGKATIVLLGFFLLVTLSKNFNILHLKESFSSLKFFLKKPWKSVLGVALSGFVCSGLFSLIENAAFASDIAYYGRAIGTVTMGLLCLWGASRMSQADKHFLIKAFLIGFLIYGSFFLEEIYGGSFISRYYFGQKSFFFERYLKGVVILVFLVWPAFGAIKYFIKSSFFKWMVWGMVTVGLFFILRRTRPDAALVAFCFSLIVFAVSYRFSIISYFLGVGSIVVLWITPLLFSKVITVDRFFHSMHLLKQSYQHRLQMWNVLAQMIEKKPFLGYGLNATHRIQDKLHLCIGYAKGTIFEGLRENLSVTPYNWGVWVCHREPLLGTHPHNGFIQIWFEFGLVGVFFLSCLLWLLTRALARIQDNFVRASAMAIFATYVVIWSISFGIWQTWMISLLFLTISLLICIKGLITKDKKDVHTRF